MSIPVSRRARATKSSQLSARRQASVATLRAWVTRWRRILPAQILSASMVRSMAAGESEPVAPTRAHSRVGTPTAASQHLAKMRLTGLVEQRAQGRARIYRLSGGHVQRLLTEALAHADHAVSGLPHHD